MLIVVTLHVIQLPADPVRDSQFMPSVKSFWSFSPHCSLMAGKYVYSVYCVSMGLRGGSEINMSLCTIIINPCVLITCVFKKPQEDSENWPHNHSCYLSKSMSRSLAAHPANMLFIGRDLSFFFLFCLPVIFCVRASWAKRCGRAAGSPPRSVPVIDSGLLLHHQ